MNTDLKTYYAQRASEYENIYDKPERQSDIQKLKDFLKSEFRGKSVFEIACGTGFWTQILAETARSIVATDINPEVINIAKEKKYSNQNVNFKIADIYVPNEIDGLFETAFGGFIWSHIPVDKLPQFIDNIHSKVRKNGQVIFIDNTYVEGSSTPIDKLDMAGNTFQKRKLENGSNPTTWF